jgi:hypothetical protein
VDLSYSFSICCTAFRFVVDKSKAIYSTVSIFCGFAVDLSYSFSIFRTAFRFVVDLSWAMKKVHNLICIESDLDLFLYKMANYWFPIHARICKLII